MPKVRHSPRAAKVLHNFPSLQTSGDNNNRVVFLSERDFNIILNCLELTDQLRNRVFYSATGDLYEIVSDEDWVIFQSYVQDLYFNLGEWIVSNEMLERIAVALESLDTKAAELVTIDEFIEELETTLGIGNVFVEALRAFFDLVPSLKVKVDASKLVVAFWESWTFKWPVLAALTGIAASQVTIAAATVGQRIGQLLLALISGLQFQTGFVQKLIDDFTGSVSWWYSTFATILGWFIPDSEGGTGGPDPDNDPEIRTTVNLNQQLAVSVVMDAFCCAIENVEENLSDMTVIPVDSAWDGLPITVPTNPDFTWDGPNDDLTKCKNAFYIVDWFVNFYGSSRWADFPGPGDPFGLVGWLNDLIRYAPPLAIPRQVVTRLLGWLIGKQPSEAALAASNIGSFAEVNRDELICTLYNATGQDDAIQDFLFYWYSNYTGAIVDIWLVEIIIRVNNTMALLWYDANLPVSVPPGYSCDCVDECANYRLAAFLPGETNAGMPMGDVSEGTLDFDTTGFVIDSRPGSHAFVQGQYVMFFTPDVETCYNLTVILSGWTVQASGLSAQISGKCGGGSQNFEFTTQAALNAALADICIGPCGSLVIRGGSGSQFTAEITVNGYICP